MGVRFVVFCSLVSESIVSNFRHGVGDSEFKQRWPSPSSLVAEIRPTAGTVRHQLLCICNRSVKVRNSEGETWSEEV